MPVTDMSGEAVKPAAGVPDTTEDEKTGPFGNFVKPVTEAS